MDFDGIKDDVFTYLIHLGYLSYDRTNQECYIPNNEIRIEWINALENSAEYKSVIEIVNNSRELLERTLACDETYIAQALDKAHMRATNPLTYNNEASFQSAIGIAYFYATSKYTIIKELPTGKGYADIALIPYIKYCNISKVATSNYFISPTEKPENNKIYHSKGEFFHNSQSQDQFLYLFCIFEVR